ncbi:unnamed protein product, partial [Mesorhabditis belari]|uniref:Uncharacterized protein n=1 Tax=Mesorhabditis belari TaxID=2138241 RepID=A0AAF3FJ23_9BILA
MNNAWLWRPKATPYTPVDEANYPVCYNRSTAKQAFKVVNQFFLGFFSVFFVIILIPWMGENFFDADHGNNSLYQNRKLCISQFCILASLLAIFAWSHREPKWTQLYIILIFPVLIIVTVTSFGTTMILANEFLDDLFSSDAHSFAPLGCLSFFGYNPRTSSAFLGFLAALIWALCTWFFAWYLVLSVTFYQYVRDFQIVLEGDGGTTGIVIDHERNQFISTWLWRPSNQNPKPYEERNYRNCCCFCCIKTVTAFRFMQLLLFAIYTPIAIFCEWRYATLFALHLVSMSIFGLFSTCCFNKPFYTQLHLILSLIDISIMTVFAEVMSGLMIYRIMENFAYRDVQQVLDWIRENLKINVTSKWEVLYLLVIPFLVLLSAIWTIKIHFNYYRFVRDRKLEMEQIVESETGSLMDHEGFQGDNPNYEPINETIEV